MVIKCLGWSGSLTDLLFQRCELTFTELLGACFLLVSTSDTAYKYESMASFSSFKWDY